MNDATINFGSIFAGYLGMEADFKIMLITFKTNIRHDIKTNATATLYNNSTQFKGVIYNKLFSEDGKLSKREKIRAIISTKLYEIFSKRLICA
jgi:hypothetical protein